MTQFEDVLETILEEYARRDSEGEFDTWEETDAFVKKKAEVLLAYVKEGPVSEDLETELDKYIKDNFTIDKEQLDRFGIEEKDYMYSMDKSDMLKMVRHFAGLFEQKYTKVLNDVMSVAYANGMAAMKHQLEKMPVSEELEKVSDKYSEDIESNYSNDMFDRGDIMKAFEAGANWQKEKDSTVSEDLEKIVEEIAEPTILNAYGTKELARRLRNTICGTSVSEDLEEASKEWLIPQLDKSYAAYGETKMMELTHFDGYAMLDAIEFGAKWQKTKDSIVSEQLEKVAELYTLDDSIKPWKNLTKEAFKAGAKWQKEQMMAKAIDGDVTFDYYGDDDKTYGCLAHDSFCLEDFGLKDRDKVKVIVIKEK